MPFFSTRYDGVRFDMDSPEYPLSRSPVVRTRNPEEMRDALYTVYGATGFSVVNSSDFQGVANYLVLPNIGLGFCGYAAKTVVEFPEGDLQGYKSASRGKRASFWAPPRRCRWTSSTSASPRQGNRVPSYSNPASSNWYSA